MTWNPNDTPRGIAGLSGREPIACALTIGVKGPSGAPIEKDRFHVLQHDVVEREYQKRGGGTYKAPARDAHPLFAAFNSADVSRRRTIPARLAHVTVAEMFEYRRQAQAPAGVPVHPKRAPACKGNGVNALRWDGNEYAEIPCPGDQCPFAQPGSGQNGAPACKPWMRFVARFDWPRDAAGKGLPNLPFKFTSGGWNAVRNFVGFFDAFTRACEGFGVDPNRVPLFGLPVVLSVVEKTNPDTKARFPVVSIAMTGEGDLIEWISHQLERGQEVRRLASASAPLALTDRELSDPAVLAADQADVSGPAAGGGTTGRAPIVLDLPGAK